MLAKSVRCRVVQPVVGTCRERVPGVPGSPRDSTRRGVDSRRWIRRPGDRIDRRSCSSTRSSRSYPDFRPGRWSLTGDEWFFAGHFPGRPTLPGVLMCEAIAQVGAVAVSHDDASPVDCRCSAASTRRGSVAKSVPATRSILECELGRMSTRGRVPGGRRSTALSPCECEAALRRRRRGELVSARRRDDDRTVVTAEAEVVRYRRSRFP